MHQLVLVAKAGFTPDHINGDGLDNRRSNLRESTATENARNRRKRKPGRSKYKGVNPQRDKTWYAFITVNHKTKRIGTFQSEELAAMAYDAEARRLFGAFALLNFPERDSLNVETVKWKPRVHPCTGVRPTKSGKWRAQIKHRAKWKHIGVFMTQQEAADAYKKAKANTV